MKKAHTQLNSQFTIAAIDEAAICACGRNGLRFESADIEDAESQTAPRRPPSPAPEILTASASAFSREARPAATTDSMTATQRCLSGKLGAMKYSACPGQQGA